MKRQWLVIGLLLMSVVGVFAQGSSKIEQEILKTEQARVNALTQGEMAKLEQLLSDDLTYTHSSGRVDSKKDFLDALKTGSVKYESMTHSNVKVALYGNTAVMRGESDLKLLSGGRPVAFRIRFLNVYVKKDGRWQMTAWQSTRLP
jgi:hypothetical protein